MPAHARIPVKFAFLAVAVAFVLAASSLSLAQYQVYKLVSTSSPTSAVDDPNLVNGWGLAFFATSPFWLSDNGTGLSTLYDHSGTIIPLVVTIPPAPSQPFGPTGTPTGLVANGSGGFPVTENGNTGSGVFIYDTLDGTISGWNPGVDVTHAVIAVDNSSKGAVYTGLAIVKTKNGTMLYAADTANNKVDVYDSTFTWQMSFTDSSVPAGLSVYGIQNVGGQLYVTFASFAANQGGVVDVFSPGGKKIRTLTSNGPGGPLQAPWGTALAPADFGALSGAVLIGNVEDGHINAFDRKTGMFLGPMTTPSGNSIKFPGLWALEFGAGNPANGDKNQLFFTAGPDGYRKGLFGMIVATGVD